MQTFQTYLPLPGISPIDATCPSCRFPYIDLDAVQASTLEQVTCTWCRRPLVPMRPKEKRAILSASRQLSDWREALKNQPELLDKVGRMEKRGDHWLLALDEQTTLLFGKALERNAAVYLVQRAGFQRPDFRS